MSTVISYIYLTFLYSVRLPLNYLISLNFAIIKFCDNLISDINIHNMDRIRTSISTGGHFACACVQPLYKEGVIAVIKMAREIQIVLFMFILVSFLIVSFTIQGNRAAEKCAVCGKTIVGEDGRPASGYKKDFLSCFGIDANTDGKICGQCRKAVTDHRKSGQKFFM